MNSKEMFRINLVNHDTSHSMYVFLLLFVYIELRPFLCFTTNQFAQKFKFLANLITYFVNMY